MTRGSSAIRGKASRWPLLTPSVEYKHPDLKKNFGQYKGYDFVDNDYDPEETPSGDPRGASTDHGTHVAGTVAANGTIKGVAPDATLLAYRVLGPGEAEQRRTSSSASNAPYRTERMS